MKSMVLAAIVAMFSVSAFAQTWGIAIEKGVMTTPCNGQTITVAGASDCNAAKIVAQNTFNQLVTLGCLKPCGTGRPTAFSATCTATADNFQINATFRCEGTATSCVSPSVPMTLATTPVYSAEYAECKAKCGASGYCDPLKFQCCVNTQLLDPCKARGLFTNKLDALATDGKVLCCSSATAKLDILAGKKVCCEAVSIRR